MRHNQNARRVRGRGNGGGHNHNSSHHHSHHSNQQNRRVNPRVQIFDSNGPDVRIRGNAYQITEKYQTLAKDAASAGDRVLAESYLQHAEHYQRFINEMTEEFNQYNQQMAAQQAQQPTFDQPQQQQAFVSGDQPATPPVENLNDLDQSFLKPRGTPHHSDQPSGDALMGQPEPETV